MWSAIKNFISRKRNKAKMGKKGLIGTRKRRTQDDSLAAAVDKSKPLGILILMLLWVVCSLVLWLPSNKTPHGALVIDQQAPKMIYAKFRFEYEDKTKTRENRQKAGDAVPLYFRINDAKIQESVNNAREFFSAITSRGDALIKKQTYQPAPGSRIAAIVAAMDRNTLFDLYHLIQDPEQRKKFVGNLELVIGQGIFSKQEKGSYKVGQNIRIIDSKGRTRLPKMAVEIPTPEEAAKEVTSKTLEFYSSMDNSDFKQMLIKIVMAIIGENGNLHFDEPQTQEARIAAMKAVPPYIIEVHKNQPVVYKDQKVTQEVLDRLAIYDKLSAEQASDRDMIERKIQITIWCLILMLVVGLYIYHIHPEVIKSNRKVWLTATVVIVALLINYGFIELFSSLSTNFSDLYPGLIFDAVPLALASILLSVMIGLRVAIYIGLFVSVLTAILLGDSYQIVLEGLVISCFAGFAVRYSTNYRSFFLRSTGVIFCTSLVLDIGFMWQAAYDPSRLLWSLILVVCNAIITSIIALVLTFIFEVLFNISTSMSLLMLCDYNHPLLKRLQLEAPGTFHHSIMVSTLAEYAASAIGADSVKARVGALFHDIGKLVKPEYFTENNPNADHKHNDLHPRMSSLIILNHVKDGVDLAMKYKLRKIICDTIEQHHGTDIVYYFYQKALKEVRDRQGSVSEQEYRYPGPLPRDKEVVIVSLADACEAASRSLQKPSPSKIEALVWEIFRKRIRDGQLDEADMTFGELAKVRDSFVKTLTMMNHGRIAYPKEEEKDEDDLFMAAQKTAIPETDATENNDDNGDQFMRPETE